jgi:hypothetical protein
MKKFTISNTFYKIIRDIYSAKYNFYDDLSQFHKILDDSPFIEKKQSILQIPELGKNDRDSVFIKDFYQYVDSEPKFMEIYREFIISTIKPLFCEDILVYQTTPNLRISFPGSTAIGRRESDPNPDIIGIHKDSEFNHSSYEINFIVPITEMYGTNSLYIEPTVNSEVSPLEYLNLTLETNELFMGNLNELKHYNRINDTGKTRFSLDFRIIPYSKYVEHTMQENLLESNNKDDISLRSVSHNKKLVVGDYFQTI